MKEAADAFLWCVAASLDMDFILHTDTQANLLMAALYPNLLINVSHTFCDNYVKPEYLTGQGMNPDFPFLTYVIGHELCHGFDANGANFNARGELGDWWSIDDRLVFRKKQEQLIGIFSQYYVGGVTFCNGVRTITEDMADLGGLEIAYYTSTRELEGKFGGEELLEKKRRFFKTYAILYAKHSSLEEKIRLVEEDEHTLNEFRINGIVNNIDEWYQLFDVTPERKFYLSPERRVYLW